MSELELTLSERFTDEDATALRAAISRHFHVSSPVQRVHRRSFDLPSTILLLGAPIAWQVLVKPAAAFAKSFGKSFGKTLGKRAGNAVSDIASEWKKNRDIKPLADVAMAFVATADRVGGKVTISVGLNIPDDYFGTVISTDSRDPLEVARVLAAFVVHAQRLADIVQAEIERGHEPIGEVLVELTPDGTVTIRWHAGSDFKAHEKNIS